VFGVLVGGSAHRIRKFDPDSKDLVSRARSSRSEAALEKPGYCRASVDDCLCRDGAGRRGGNIRMDEVRIEDDDNGHPPPWAWL
jgi:hypothetical protein